MVQLLAACQRLHHDQIEDLDPMTCVHGNPDGACPNARCKEDAPDAQGWTCPVCDSHMVCSPAEFSRHVDACNEYLEHGHNLPIGLSVPYRTFTITGFEPVTEEQRASNFGYNFPITVPADPELCDACFGIGGHMTDCAAQPPAPITFAKLPEQSQLTRDELHALAEYRRAMDEQGVEVPLTLQECEILKARVTGLNSVARGEPRPLTRDELTEVPDERLKLYAELREAMERADKP
jgi:hypothetical protein